MESQGGKLIAPNFFLSLLQVKDLISENNFCPTEKEKKITNCLLKLTKVLEKLRILKKSLLIKLDYFYVIKLESYSVHGYKLLPWP